MGWIGLGGIGAAGGMLAPAVLLAQDSLLLQVEHLREPRITTKADQAVIEVRAQGDPQLVGARAFGLVFQLYFSMPETPRGAGAGAPRARWPVTFEAPRSEWQGRYAMPVPATVTQLPPHQPGEGLTAAITTWEYGEVAEILHVGPYHAEEPTIARLMEFVGAQGYVIAGDHEEEYLRGPTMSGPGDPQRYVTILRYRVRRAGGP